MTPLRGAGLGRAAVRGVAAGVAVGILAVTVVGLALGLRGLTVRSGSMSPAIGTGDVVVQRMVPAASLRVGDVATFRDPEGAPRLITHRVVGIARRGDVVEVVTRGDANTRAERWSIAADGRVGRVAGRVPHAGAALAWTTTPAGRLATLGLPPVALAAWALAGIWRPRRRTA